MKGTGRVTFGGAGIAGGVGADITLDDGSKWRFVGAAAGIAPGGSSFQAKGEFPGHSHIEGMCTFSLVGAGVVAGAWEIKWSDNQGFIGGLSGNGWGASVNFSGGLGHWSKA